MSDNKQIRKVGKKVIKVLSNRKGFDWWFEDLEGPLKSEIIMDVGRAAIKAVKENA
jgi:hypothetical protein